MPPGVKNIPWSALGRYGGVLKPNHSSGMTWWLARAGEKELTIEVPSNPVESTWGLSDGDYTFRADWVREAFRQGGLEPSAEFAKEYFTTTWVRHDPLRGPGDPGDPDDPNDPDEQPPDFPAPDPPTQDPNEQPPDFPAPDPPGERERGPGGK